MRGMSGCFLVIWQFLVVTPIWLFMIFGMLKATDPPDYVWILFFIYLPAYIIGVIISGIFTVLEDD